MRVTRPTLAPIGAALLALALAGCGSGEAKDAVPETATGSLEHLAAEVKCTPNMQTDADEIRQAVCKNPDGKFILATFSTDRGQREWINGAKDYGGHYLVGRKWVAVGETSTVTALRGTLGGDIEEGTDHSAHESGEPSDGATHSAH
ncbi:hypothetical protein [Streptomyces sp. ALI-76-A]|jgi:hypothetical protein|uniref:hypothetical protein n=1 Tax=Streptomyces sp. ALI-76-A TaxID=3025736 RepID=UPI00256F12E0|nr:hypothetical protein [Streptomyces sp. ALI-76-A]MDL5201173.1 hypothetical protein [Streptomyces sp. ALI-76-A]